MKIIISHSQTKRKIEGSFKICGSQEDLKTLAYLILAKADDFAYGWVDIYEAPPVIPNTEPIGWDE